MYLTPPVAFVTKTYLKLLLYLTVLSTIYESALISCQYFNITGVNGQSGFQFNPLNDYVTCQNSRNGSTLKKTINSTTIFGKYNI